MPRPAITTISARITTSCSGRWATGPRIACSARATSLTWLTNSKNASGLHMRRILVTGGAGFLGSHLCERLLAAGAEVLCVDNFYTGRRGNVAHLLANPRFELVR